MLKGNSLRELTSTEFAWHRMKRLEGYEGLGGRPIDYIVWVELRNGNFIELDAHDEDHALKLIHLWLEHGEGTVTASYREVNGDGTFGDTIEIFDPTFDEDVFDFDDDYKEVNNAL